MYAAIDIGGTKINISIFSSLSPDSLVKSHIISTQRDFGKDTTAIAEILSSFNGKIDSVGAIMPGFVIDPNKGIVTAAFMKNWQGADFKSFLIKILGTKQIFLEHDGLGLGLAEKIYAGHDKDFCLISWGTGIGATYIRTVGDKIVPQRMEYGFHYLKGTLMHELLGGDNFNKRFEVNSPEEMNEFHWNTIVDDFAQAIVNLMVINFPPEIVWTGGISNKHKDVVARIMKRAQEIFPYWEIPKISFSTLAEENSAIGSLALINYMLNK